jgi:hypothetical protein
MFLLIKPHKPILNVWKFTRSISKMDSSIDYTKWSIEKLVERVKTLENNLQDVNSKSVDQKRKKKTFIAKLKQISSSQFTTKDRDKELETF